MSPRCYPDPWETLPRRLWSKVQKTDTCWLWTGTKTPEGYGVITIGKTGRLVAHRAAWIVTNGGIPDGLHLDHLCRNPTCVRPDHLEPVTHAENNRRGFSPSALNARKVDCKRGHPLRGPNLYVDRHGNRSCKSCKRLQKRGLIGSAA